MSDKPNDLSHLDYVSLLAAVRETNRPPGGKSTVAGLARRLGIGPQSRVLEIGSNTGFTSIELAKITGCSIRGIDVNPSAVAQAEKWRHTLAGGLSDRIEFFAATSTAIPFDDESFDVVVCGGANTFIAQKAQSFAEYRRVLRPYGQVSITNLYYHSPPPTDLLDELNEILGFEVPAHDVTGWLNTLVLPTWEMLGIETTRLTARPNEVVDAYVDWICAPDRLQVQLENQKIIQNSWRQVMHTFNRNHKYLGYFELTLRKQETGEIEQPELFLRPGVYDPFFTHTTVPLSL